MRLSDDDIVCPGKRGGAGGEHEHDGSGDAGLGVVSQNPWLGANTAGSEFPFWNSAI